MNERIEQLAEQAGMTIDKYGLARDAETGLEDGVDIYKFARLLVLECIAMADEFEIEVNRSGLVDRMKEHFGVERVG